jgi:DDE superfamily endonuclease
MNKRHELDAYTVEGTVESAVVIGCFDQFCKVMQGPTVVVMDNASIHTSEAFQEEIPKWEKQGLSIFYLPEYAPELNLIEGIVSGSPVGGLHFAQPTRCHPTTLNACYHVVLWCLSTCEMP